jgi:hypothetical protein
MSKHFSPSSEPLNDDRLSSTTFCGSVTKYSLIFSKSISFSGFSILKLKFSFIETVQLKVSVSQLWSSLMLK